MVEPGSDAEEQIEDEISADDSKDAEKGGINLLDDIFAEDDAEDSEHLKAFADLEQLTMPTGSHERRRGVRCFKRRQISRRKLVAIGLSRFLIPRRA